MFRQLLRISIIAIFVRNPITSSEINIRIILFIIGNSSYLTMFRRTNRFVLYKENNQRITPSILKSCFNVERVPETFSALSCSYLLLSPRHFHYHLQQLRILAYSRYFYSLPPDVIRVVVVDEPLRTPFVTRKLFNALLLHS